MIVHLIFCLLLYCLQPLLKKALVIARLVSNEKVGRALSKYHSNSALDQRLVVQDSTIVNAGLGLFNGSTRPILKGETVCHDTGLLHNHQSKREQEDQSYMAFVGYVNAFDEDVFVDAKSVLGVKAVPVHTCTFLYFSLCVVQCVKIERNHFKPSNKY